MKTNKKLFITIPAAAVAVLSTVMVRAEYCPVCTDKPDAVDGCSLKIDYQLDICQGSGSTWECGEGAAYYPEYKYYIGNENTANCEWTYGGTAVSSAEETPCVTTGEDC